ncbi:hypothetical protein MPSEU_000908700 [Mayamaea pseudoterrestris]|nr:hypothetical protein MPSEU_000908700 [Mayamaea pseudoterrestris]
MQADGPSTGAHTGAPEGFPCSLMISMVTVAPSGRCPYWRQKDFPSRRTELRDATGFHHHMNIRDKGLAMQVLIGCSIGAPVAPSRQMPLQLALRRIFLLAVTELLGCHGGVSPHQMNIRDKGLAMQVLIGCSIGAPVAPSRQMALQLALRRIFLLAVTELLGCHGGVSPHQMNIRDKGLAMQVLIGCSIGAPVAPSKQMSLQVVLRRIFLLAVTELLGCHGGVSPRQMNIRDKGLAMQMLIGCSIGAPVAPSRQMPLQLALRRIFLLAVTELLGCHGGVSPHQMNIRDKGLAMQVLIGCSIGAPVAPSRQMALQLALRRIFLLAVTELLGCHGGVSPHQMNIRDKGLAMQVLIGCSIGAPVAPSRQMALQLALRRIFLLAITELLGCHGGVSPRQMNIRDKGLAMQVLIGCSIGAPVAPSRQMPLQLALRRIFLLAVTELLGCHGGVSPRQMNIQDKGLAMQVLIGCSIGAPVAPSRQMALQLALRRIFLLAITELLGCHGGVSPHQMNIRDKGLAMQVLIGCSIGAPVAPSRQMALQLALRRIFLLAITELLGCHGGVSPHQMNIRDKGLAMQVLIGCSIGAPVAPSRQMPLQLALRRIFLLAVTELLGCHGGVSPHQMNIQDKGLAMQVLIGCSIGAPVAPSRQMALQLALRRFFLLAVTELLGCHGGVSPRQMNIRDKGLAMQVLIGCSIGAPVAPSRQMALQLALRRIFLLAVTELLGCHGGVSPHQMNIWDKGLAMQVLIGCSIGAPVAPSRQMALQLALRRFFLLAVTELLGCHGGVSPRQMNIRDKGLAMQVLIGCSIGAPVAPSRQMALQLALRRIFLLAVTELLGCHGGVSPRQMNIRDKGLAMQVLIGCSIGAPVAPSRQMALQLALRRIFLLAVTELLGCHGGVSPRQMNIRDKGLAMQVLIGCSIGAPVAPSRQMPLQLALRRIFLLAITELLGCHRGVLLHQMNIQDKGLAMQVLIGCSIGAPVAPSRQMALQLVLRRFFLLAVTELLGCHGGVSPHQMNIRDKGLAMQVLIGCSIGAPVALSRQMPLQLVLRRFFLLAVTELLGCHGGVSPRQMNIQDKGLAMQVLIGCSIGAPVAPSRQMALQLALRRFFLLAVTELLGCHGGVSPRQMNIRDKGLAMQVLIGCSIGAPVAPSRQMALQLALRRFFLLAVTGLFGCIGGVSPRQMNIQDKGLAMQVLIGCSIGAPVAPSRQMALQLALRRIFLLTVTEVLGCHGGVSPHQMNILDKGLAMQVLIGCSIGAPVAPSRQMAPLLALRRFFLLAVTEILGCHGGISPHQMNIRDKGLAMQVLIGCSIGAPVAPSRQMAL